MQRVKQALEISAMLLELPGIEGTTLQDLPLPFEVRLDPLHSRSVIQEFQGVITQNGQLVHRGDYVKLTSSEVTSLFLFQCVHSIYEAYYILIGGNVLWSFSWLLQAT